MFPLSQLLKHTVPPSYSQGKMLSSVEDLLFLKLHLFQFYTYPCISRKIVMFYKTSDINCWGKKKTPDFPSTDTVSKSGNFHNNILLFYYYKVYTAFPLTILWISNS